MALPRRRFGYRLTDVGNLPSRGHIMPIDIPKPAAGILQPKHSKETEQIWAIPAQPQK